MTHGDSGNNCSKASINTRNQYKPRCLTKIMKRICGDFGDNCLEGPRITGNYSDP